MAHPGDANFYDSLKYSNVVKNVAVSFTTTGLGTIWTPTSGKKFRLMGWHLIVGVDIILNATSTKGLTVQLVDNAVATAWGPALGHVGPVGAITTNIESKGDLKEGWLSATADNVLKVTAHHKGTTESIDTGYLMVAGTVWGREE